MIVGGNPVPAGAVADAVVSAKAFLRVAQSDEDALIGTLAASAIRLGEGFCGHALIARDFEEIVPVSGEWRRLAMTPVAAIGDVVGLPAEGAAFALPVDAYAIDIDANGDGWVRVHRPGAAGRAKVSYSAGIAADWAGLPEPIAQGIVRLTAHFYANRDADAAREPPAAVAALWRPWRRMPFGGAQVRRVG